MTNATPKRRQGGRAAHGTQSVYTGVRLPQALRQQLEQYAKDNNITLSRLICEIMQDWVTVNS